MADDQDQSEKTEDPTPHRLAKAREEGDVTSSKEINTWFLLLGTGLCIAFALPMMAGGLVDILRPFIERPHALSLETNELPDAIGGLGWLVLGTLLVPLGLLVALALAGSLIQNGVVISAKSMQPDLGKISPLKGLKRLFGLNSLMEFFKGLAKLGVVGLIVVIVLVPLSERIETMPGLEMTAVLDLTRDAALQVVGAVIAVMLVIAGADLVFQRYEHMKKLRMSRQDLKDEYKQTEGNPVVKQRFRQIRMERQRRRMMSAVPTADVVIANPTHFAVALKYDEGAMRAPRCVAKGADNVALRIREVARENGVAVIENPPLARALHASVEVDEEIPEQHYRAVAEVISYVWRLKGRGVGA